MFDHILLTDEQKHLLTEMVEADRRFRPKRQPFLCASEYHRYFIAHPGFPEDEGNALTTYKRH